jgi:co-chaperonin GroES (HSP10)
MPTIRHYLPKEKIEKVKPHINYVLVKIDDPNEYRVTEGGIFLSVIEGEGTEAPLSKDINRFGIVISICNRLRFNTSSRTQTTRKGDLNVAAYDTLENDVDIEVRVGDVVWYSFISGNNCDEFVTTEVEKDKYDRPIRYTYKLLRYDSLRLIRRGNSIKTLNGNVIIRPKENIVESSLELVHAKYELPSGDVFDSKLDTLRGEVVYSGTPNKSYRAPQFSDGEGVSSGDHIVCMIAPNMIRNFEYSLHGKFEKGLRIVRGCDVFGVLGVFDEHDFVRCLKNRVLVSPTREYNIVGQEKVLDKGIVYACNTSELTKGDFIYFSKGKGIDLELNGKKLLMMLVTDVLCKID